MFFQAINQMITAGTDLSINIRRVNSNLTVAVVPRRSGVKDGERIVPLILNGTPEELDAGFLQAVGTPVQKAQGILTNLETFEKQAEQAVSQSKAARSAAEKESKEVREKREKMEKLLKKAEDATVSYTHLRAHETGKGAGTSGQAEGNRRKNGGSTEKGIGGKPVRHGTTANVQAAAGSTTAGIATGGSPGTAIPERRANPDVLARTTCPGSATRCTAASTARTIYAARTTSATGPATGSSTTARNPVPSTGTDATGTDGRKSMDATGFATTTVCTGTGGRKNL
mgnify:CR=1 FL=1